MKKHSTIPIHHFNTAHSDDVTFRVVELQTKTGYIESEPHRHTYYEIFFFINGGGTHMIDFENIDIHSNGLHFVSPGQVHMVSRGMGSNGYVIMFSREFFYFNTENKNMLLEFPFLDNPTTRNYLNVTEEQSEALLQLVQVMAKEDKAKGAYREDILRAYINIFLLKCKAIYEASGNYHKPNESSAAQLLQNFRLLVEDQFIKCHKVNEYAELLSVTPNHLNEITKKVTGRTASELIQDRLLLEARRLLLHSNLTGKEVAYSLGFNDPSYFSRFFRTNTGLSPEAFRTQNREKYLQS
jgi:AraC-like DNA-binding protein/mannose-6-phosphate isomerase-like protein (cupin superfamily)